MQPLAVVAVIGAVVLLQGWVLHWHYRGYIDDLREMLDHERKRRHLEELRAETLSDALFGRARTRQPGDEKLRN
jgi:hypothetical protein